MCTVAASRPLRVFTVVAALAFAIAAPAVLAQTTPRFEVPLYVTDGQSRDTLYIGILPNANFCIVGTDSINGRAEFFLPPIPPNGVFDARLVWPRSGSNLACFDQGSRYDYRPYTSGAQRDTFRVRTQVGTGTSIIVSWPAGLDTRFTTLTMRHFDGTSNITTNMLTNTSVDITNSEGDPHVGTIFSGGLVLPVDPPSAPALISPVDGSLNVSLTPVLRWNSVATATSYRLQVARDSLFTVLVFDDSTLVDTSRQVGPLSSSTLYYWRARAKNSGGSSPYSTRFRFTTTQAPSAPVLVTPLDSATRVPTAAKFTWRLVPGATSYHLQVATGPNFTTLLVSDSTITDTTRAVAPLPYSAMLRWRVRARNSSGPGDWSPPRVFTVMQEPPSVPVQLAPTNNQINAPVEVLIRWTNAVLGAGYHLQIAHDTLMTNQFWSDSTLIDTTRTIRVAPTTAYYWRVRARNTEQTFGLYSPVQRFTTANVPPVIPIPTYPANGDTGVPRDVTLRWLGSPGALSYRVQVSTDIGFTQILADSLVLETELTPGILPSRVSVFWRVRANGTIGPSAWSTVRSFRTGSIITSVDPDPEDRIPSGFVLHQNYPNPFNPSTTIPFELASSANVMLKVYDLLGREVRTLINQEMSSGTYQVRWNGQNEYDQSVPSGVYFVRMTATTAGASEVFAATRRVVLVK